jgi:hypothetical protein
MTTTRLQKFVERGAYGEGPGRTAYVLDPNSLPQAAEGFDWNKVDAFSAAEEILNDPRLKEIFKAAIRNGHAIVEPGLKAKAK